MPGKDVFHLINQCLFFSADLDFIDGPFSADLPVGSTVNTTACFNVTIIDDMVVDSTSSNLEIIGLSLNADSNPLITAASMSLDMVSIVINDNDGESVDDIFIVNVV